MASANLLDRLIGAIAPRDQRRIERRQATNLLDRLIGAIAPQAGLRRLRARDLLTRAYEGASQRDGWRPKRPGASANADHRADAATLRARARSLVQNTPYMSRGLTSLVSNVIGTGITPRSLAVNDGQRATIKKLWAEWVKVADADGRINFYGLQAAAYRAMKQDGEVLLRIRPRRLADGLPVPMQLQLLEIDWLDSYRNGNEGGNTVINGIEYDAIGAVAAYWLYNQHPGDANVTARTGTTSRRVPAAGIIHLYNPERPGQGRGITALASVISRVRDLTLYEDAEAQRKNLESRLGVIASGDVSQMDNGAPGLAGDAEQARQTGSLGELASGGITQIADGVNLTVIEPKAAPGYVDYVKYQLHLISAGFGPTYEMMTGDVSETNFSSARVRLIDFRRECEQEQWLLLVPNFLERVWAAFIDAAVDSGKLRQADYAVDWSTPKWDYVNPEQDVKADLAEISGGLSSISEKLRRRGYDPEVVFAEIKSDFDRLKADGTLNILAFLQRGQHFDPPANAVAAAARSLEHVETASALRGLEAQGLQQRDLIAEVMRAHDRAAAQTSAQRELPQPVINIHQAPVTVHPAEVRVQLPETTVNIEAIMPAPVIEVRADAPAVTVINEITAQAAPAQVTIAHPSKTVAEHERDPDTQEILRTVTTFKGQA